jgi:hypothetical protein
MLAFQYPWNREHSGGNYSGLLNGDPSFQTSPADSVPLMAFSACNQLLVPVRRSSLFYIGVRNNKGFRFNRSRDTARSDASAARQMKHDDLATSEWGGLNGREAGGPNQEDRMDPESFPQTPLVLPRD